MSNNDALAACMHSLVDSHRFPGALRSDFILQLINNASRRLVSGSIAVRQVPPESAESSSLPLEPWQLTPRDPCYEVHHFISAVPQFGRLKHVLFVLTQKTIRRRIKKKTATG